MDETNINSGRVSKTKLKKNLLLNSPQALSKYKHTYKLENIREHGAAQIQN
jgi:hypothetical protein